MRLSQYVRYLLFSKQSHQSHGLLICILSSFLGIFSLISRRLVSEIYLFVFHSVLNQLMSCHVSVEFVRSYLTLSSEPNLSNPFSFICYEIISWFHFD